MPQINDTTGNIKTSSIVRVDAKFESVNFKAIPRGTVDIVEGGLMVRDSGGLAAKPAATAKQVYINFSNPDAPQTKDEQKINIAGGTLFEVGLSSGGYAGIIGANTRIGLPKTDQFFFGTDVALLVVGDRLELKAETDANASRYPDVKFARRSGANYIFATVDAIETGAGITLVWLLFNSMGYQS